MKRLAVPSRFAVVGLACALLHNAIMIGLDRLHVHYALAAVVSFAVVVLAGYALHVSYTFREVASLGSFVRYAAGMAANYPATVALLFLMCDVAGLPVAVAAPAGTLAMFGWNYIASRWAIVRARRGGPTEPVTPT